VILDGFGEEDLYIFNHHLFELRLSKRAVVDVAGEVFFVMSFFLCTFAADLVTL